MRKIVITIITIISSFSNYAQDEIILGTKHVLQSTALSKNRNVYVYIPDDYKTSSKTYPVLYILNGERWFYNGVNLAKTFPELNLTPEFIVVGVNVNTIENPRERYAFFTQNSQNLNDFLEKELLPFIDDNYRTSKERMLFGWEYAGGFAIESLFKKPSMFNAYFAASPFPAAGQRLQLIEQEIVKKPDLDTFLYFSASINEGQVKEQVEQLAMFLKEKAPKTLRWKHHFIEDETSTGIGHITTPFSTLYKSLRAYFFDYGRLEFSSIEHYNSAGGLEYVKQYYSNRAKRYGLKDAIPLEGMFSLVRMTTKENNFSAFDTLMTDFMKRGFIEMVDPGNAIRYAQYYLINKDTENAKNIYETLIKKHPNEPSPINGLGHVYEEQNNKREAFKWYKKAIALAKKGNHPRLTQFEKDLTNIKQK